MIIDWIVNFMTMSSEAVEGSPSFISAFSVKFHRDQINSISGSKSKSMKLTEEEKMNGCRLGLDTHADVSCIGKHGRIIEILDGQYCTVYPFNDSYSPMERVRSVNAAFAVDTRDGPPALRGGEESPFSPHCGEGAPCPAPAR